MMNDPQLPQIKRIVERAERILLLSHVRPDGDAVGSLLGMGLALQNAGKTVCMALVDGVPDGLRHLAGADQIVREPKGTFDAVMVLDCSGLDRTGEMLPPGERPDVNIDHHISNEYFARVIP